MTDHLKKLPLTLTSNKVDPDKPNPKIGVGLLKFNCDGRYLATRNDNMPCVLWIWDIMEVKQIALIQQLAPIQSVLWNPLVPGSLVFTCGGSHVYSWSGETLGCDAIEIPAGKKNTCYLIPIRVIWHIYHWNSQLFCAGHEMESRWQIPRSHGQGQVYRCLPS